MLDVEDGDWRLVRFDRNGIDIGRWVVPAPEDAVVTEGAISIEVLGLFVDAGCVTGADTQCPEVFRDAFGVDLLVTNRSDAEIEPAPVRAPDRSEVPAWFESSSGTPYPLIDAAAPGFPPGESSPAFALFRGVGELAGGGLVHTAFGEGTGEVHHEFRLPIPAYPHAWG